MSGDVNGDAYPDAQIEWVIGRNKTTGLLFLADGNGGRFDFDAVHAPAIAVALSEYCRDNDERSVVRDEWSELWDDEDDEVDQ